MSTADETREVPRGYKMSFSSAVFLWKNFHLSLLTMKRSQMMSWLTSLEFGLAPLLLLLCAMKTERNSNRENEMNMLFHKHFNTLNTFFLPHSSVSKGKTFFFYFLRKAYKFYLPSDCPDLTPSFAGDGVENEEISRNVTFSD